MSHFRSFALIALWLAAPAFSCGAFAQNYRAKWPSEAKVDAALEYLKDSYGDVPLRINCKAPNGKAEIIICADPYLVKLALLTARASFYGTENATRQRLNRRSKDVWSVPKECSTVECIYTSFKRQFDVAGAGPWNPFE
ncbi:MAG: hypothetical protein KF854_00845 [Nitrospira sp.]|nr:hypothetical protein [Nitrospira sp.]MBX3513118.1 hypothetical protein [Xanthobacteraceae bacterium]